MRVTSDRRFIEDAFPAKEVGINSAKERNIHSGHIATLHVWWARRPTTASRATSYAALIPTPTDDNELQRKQEFIVQLSDWKNTLNQSIIQHAKKHISHSFTEGPPKVLDPFAGGGAIPLEAIRLGCETYSGDLNPVSVLIQKCTLEYPQRFGQYSESKDEGLLERFDSENTLVADIKKWGAWVLETVKQEISKYYPDGPNGLRPLGYLWARTIPCQNPSCGVQIPLMRQFWLSKKKRKMALQPVVKNGGVEFQIVGAGHERMPKGFDPGDGTVSRAVVTCPVCGSVVDRKTTHRLFKENKAGQRLVAIVMVNPRRPGRVYRTATKEDLEIFASVRPHLLRKRKKLLSEWGIDPIPNEPTPEGKGRGAERAFSVRNYNLNTWGDLFNIRQKLALVAITKAIRDAYPEMLDAGYKRDYAKAIASYLSLALDFVADYNSTLCQWKGGIESVGHTFGRAALPMTWDYVETNPIGSFVGSFWNGIRKICRVVGPLSMSSSTPAMVSQFSATVLPFQDCYFDAVFTDPPYYDNVPYSYLSDFFYVWLKRAVGYLYPELFSTPQTPKANEIVAYSHHPGGFAEGKRFFETKMGEAIKEISRVLKPGGIAIFVYAHKSTEGWETLVNSLLDSSLNITGAWPVHTELGARLRAANSAALASSIYIVARKIERQPTGIYKDVKGELRNHLDTKLDRLWKEGIGGADFFIAAIGSGIEVFGKYQNVIDFEGNRIRADRLLDDVREIATNFAVRQILHDGFPDKVTHLTKFYILYRWNYKSASIHFDEARKLAQSCGIDLAEHWGKRGFIRKHKEFIRVVGPKNRKIEEVQGQTEIIDVLHYVLLLWEKGMKAEISEVLSELNLHLSDTFWKVAQAISQTLPIQDKEKKLLDGLLAGMNGYRDEDRYVQEMLE